MNAMNTATWDLWMYENNVYPYGDRTLQEAIDSPKTVWLINCRLPINRLQLPVKEPIGSI